MKIIGVEQGTNKIEKGKSLYYYQAIITLEDGSKIPYLMRESKLRALKTKILAMPYEIYGATYTKDGLVLISYNSNL